MCGIIGGSFTGETERLRAKFECALEEMEHRGPDDQGYEVLSPTTKHSLMLGHTRLSILDLSKAGHQPMTSFDGLLTMVYNGEVFNYKELREELKSNGYEFNTQTDTEVLLNAFHCWGQKCLTKLVGMFAFAIFNHKENKLFLARDAFGIKPLFYSYEDGSLVFGSEIPSILELLDKKPEPDMQSAYDYLVHGVYDHNEHTFFRGIKHLMPASFIEYDFNKELLHKPRKWWTPSTEVDTSISFEDAVKRVREMFLENVRLHLRSDVPLGAALSGGVDSSAIVCAMRQLEPDMPIHTFSYIAKGSIKSEEKWVDIVNGHVDAISHKVVATPDELLEDLEVLVRAQGEPFASTSIYAQYKVFGEAKRKGITVTLDGQGADELLAGYSGYPGERILSMLEVNSLSEVFSFINRWSKYPGRSRKSAVMYLFRKILPDYFYRVAWRVIGRSAKPDWLNIENFRNQDVTFQEDRMQGSPLAKGRRVIEQLAYSLKHRGLPKLLRHGDRNSMHFSIESRVPFLTTQFADYLYSLPENYLISLDGETKHVFKEAMKGILPESVLARKDKVGFDPDSKNWKDYYVDKIQSFEFPENDKIFSPQLKQNLESLPEQQLWRILNYRLFYSLFM